MNKPRANHPVGSSLGCGNVHAFETLNKNSSAVWPETLRDDNSEEGEPNGGEEYEEYDER